MKFAFYTQGCKVNQCETQALEKLAAARGHQLVGRDADACVLNTCTVTQAGDRKNLRALHRIRRENPGAIVAVCGCFSQLNAAQLDGVADVICGTQHRAQVIELCERAHAAGGAPACQVAPLPARPAFECLPAGSLRQRTRAYLKIQDGCDQFCTYCIIPYARGRSRSLPLQRAAEQAGSLARQGMREIILTGIEIASYGRDLPEQPSLTDVVLAVAQAAPGVRLRLGSLEPRVVDEAFCRALAPLGEQLAWHFHLSLQSGCDETLRRMNRKYTTGQYAQALSLLRRWFPRCAITTDLIAGFPGETAQQWQQTQDFVQRCGLSNLHAFAYSPRPGTPASRYPHPVPEEEKRRRHDWAAQLSDRLRRQYRAAFLGQELTILMERPRRGGSDGHSRYDFTVRLPGYRGAANQWVRAVPTQLDESGMLIGRMVEG